MYNASPMSRNSPGYPMTPYPPVPPPSPRRRRRRPRFRFRWEIILAILTVLAFLFIRRGIAPSFDIDDLARVLQVHDEMKFRRLICLGIICTAVAIICRVLRPSNQKDDES